MFENWSLFLRSNPPPERRGRLDIAEHDFTTGIPADGFDVVLCCRAFQGLSPTKMASAAKHFCAALRPGGAAIIETVNVQGQLRDVIEDSLAEGGFFLPFGATKQWYRKKLDSTGILYHMVLGRPYIPAAGQYPDRKRKEYSTRDQEILDSFRSEYEARLAAEEPSVKAALDDPERRVAHVVYNTG